MRHVIKLSKCGTPPIDHIKFPNVKFRIVPSINDPHINDLKNELSELDPVLQRNIGIISEAHGLEKLAQTIEIGDTIAVSDASIGSRSRASHSYIITTTNRKYYMMGAAPIDCDVDDVESTRAELFGQIAVHSIYQAEKWKYSVIIAIHYAKTQLIL